VQGEQLESVFKMPLAKAMTDLVLLTSCVSSLLHGHFFASENLTHAMALSRPMGLPTIKTHKLNLERNDG